MWWPLKTLGNPVRTTGPLPNAMNSAMTPTTCWPSTARPIRRRGRLPPPYWLPTNADYRCDYVARQIGVKDKYQLTVTSQEKDAMLAVLHTCPGQAVPADQ